MIDGPGRILARCPLFTGLERARPHRLEKSVVNAFLGFDIYLKNKPTIKTLSTYPPDKFSSLVDRLKAFQEISKFNAIKVDPPHMVRSVEFGELSDNFLKDCIRKGTLLDLRGLEVSLAKFNARENVHDARPVGIPSSVAPESKTEIATPIVFLPGARNVLTADGLLNPAALNPWHPYPTTPREYRQMIDYIMAITGGFGDAKELRHVDHFSDEKLRAAGVKVLYPRIPGYDCTAVILDPRKHAGDFFGRMVFDADELSQAATYKATDIIGCTYPKIAYYVNRFFSATRVGIVFFGDMPVSFSSVSLHETTFDGKPLVYAFIHFTMTLGGFQGARLSTYLATQMLVSMYTDNLIHDRGKNLFVDKKGKVQNEYLSMWAGAHTGRIPAGHTFLTSFDVLNPKIERSQAIVSAIVGDADQRNYGDRGDRPPLIQVRPYAFRDPKVYSSDTSYKEIPPRERALSSAPEVIDILGGEEEILKGSGAYYFGLINLNRIFARQKKNKQVIKVSGPVGQFISGITGGLIDRL